MKRRDLLKSVLYAAPLAAIGLSGCKQESKQISIKEDKEEFDIIPKQTDIYKFSVPLVFNHEFIDIMAGYNQIYKKSQVEVLYNNIPWPAMEKFNEWFQTRRGENREIKSFDDFAKYAKHAMDNGFKVCYLINSPKPFNDKDIKPLLGDFYKLLDDIYKLGIRQIKVASTQVARLVVEHNNEFELTASVLFEYHNIAQYAHFMEGIPNVKRIVVTKDENQNFQFLKNLKKMFPDITFEMMVDEGCIKNCPSRYFCMSDSETTEIGNRLGCEYTKKSQKNWLITFYENGQIFPWHFPYYSAIGINHFKAVQTHNRAEDKNNHAIKAYMDYAEYGFESILMQKYVTQNIKPFSDLPKTVSYKKMLEYFPDIEYFVKHGHECGDKCGVECNYCKDRANELEKFVKSFS